MKSYGATLIRVTVGAIYLMHAYRMLFVTRHDVTASFFSRTMGYEHAGVLAWIVIVAHAVGGFLLVLGVLTRVAAAANGVILGVLLVRTYLPQGFFLTGAEGQWGLYRATVVGYEYVLLLTVATLALVFLGSGPLALRPSK